MFFTLAVKVPTLVNVCPDGTVIPAFVVISPDDVKPADVINPVVFSVPPTFQCSEVTKWVMNNVITCS